MPKRAPNVFSQLTNEELDVVDEALTNYQPTLDEFWSDKEASSMEKVRKLLLRSVARSQRERE